VRSLLELATVLKYQHGLAVSDREIAEAMLRTGDALKAHFVVVRGRAGDKLLIADPAYGNRTMDLEAFESAWTQNIGFIVRRRDGIVPPTNSRKVPLTRCGRLT
jgi:predicted double-glycine peptidase